MEHNFEDKDFYLQGYEKIVIPILQTGKSSWPERFSIKYIENLRKRVGEKKFLSQMMLIPPDKEESYFDEKYLSYYSAEPKITEHNFIPFLKIGDNQIEKSTAYWDPSSGKNSADNSVLIIAYKDDKEIYYIDEIKYINQFVSDDINISEQIDFIIEQLKKQPIPSINIETNGIGKFIPQLFKKALLKEGLNVSINEVHNRISKNIRIIESLEAPLSSGFIKFSEKLKDSLFMQEYKNWNPYNNFKDDGLDALAGIMMSNMAGIFNRLKNPLKTRGNFRTYKIKNY